RREDRARDRRARQDPFPGGLAGLGQGRRHRELQTATDVAFPPLTTEGRNTMKLHQRPLAAGLLAAGLLALVLALPAAAPARAQTFSADQRGEIERIVKEYLLSHPELLQEVMSELEKRQATAEAEKHRAAVAEHGASIFTSPRQVTLGNAEG